MTGSPTSDAEVWLTVAREALARATDEIHAHDDLDTHLDLCTALMEFERATGEPRGGARAELGRAFEIMRATRGLAPWLYGGAAQAGWTALRLSRLARTAPPRLDPIDAVVIQWTEQYPQDHDIDLPRGLLGLGVYGLAHPSETVREKILSGVVRTIDERLEREESGAFLRLADTPYRRGTKPTDIGQRDLGVAHGNAGLLAFLSSAALVEGVIGAAAARLLREVFGWLRNQRSLVEGTVFPQAVETRYQVTRSAWCYGDPGVSLALFLAADALGARTSEAVAARNLAAETANAVLRRGFDQFGIHDACLCHGSAGLVYFAQRMLQTLGGDGWRAFRDHWCQDILRRVADGPLTYLFPPGTRTNPSFLEGDLGAALVLLYAATGVRPQWEELMLTSAPESARTVMGAA